MYQCNCGKVFDKQSSLNSHARFCKLYVKKNKKSFYKKEDNTYECECGRSFEKSQSLNSHFSHCITHRKGEAVVKRSVGWNLSKESRIKGGKTYSNKILTGEIAPSFKDKHHSIETREMISSKMIECNNGYIKCKYYEIFSKYSGNIEKVQGTWELKFATRLNELNISWEKGSKYSLTYQREIKKKYIPDFYLPDFNIYVEIKGFWFKSKDGRIDDKLKMELVSQQNPALNLIVLDSIEKIENFKL